MRLLRPVIMSPVIDYEAMISPLFRWPNLVCHYMEISFKPSCVPVVLIDGEQLADFMIDKRIGVQRELIEIYDFEQDLLWD